MAFLKQGTESGSNRCLCSTCTLTMQVSQDKTSQAKYIRDQPKVSTPHGLVWRPMQNVFARLLARFQCDRALPREGVGLYTLCRTFNIVFQDITIH